MDGQLVEQLYKKPLGFVINQYLFDSVKKYYNWSLIEVPDSFMAGFLPYIFGIFPCEVKILFHAK